ncbi:MAG: type I-E CRISPR-associated protein Cas6/Cse3/CasE [Hyphomonadaceae bacterium]|nr:type I-E CRISPR-associated protein Cas6/Cse3/CasE [Hyphomonadaceae bacterium]
MTHYLSRLTLSRDPSIKSVAPLLNPSPGTNHGHAASAHHRLVWSAFSDGSDAPRDFLWRAEDRGAFYVLSATPPKQSALFEAAEIKPFDPALFPGDRLDFRLRVHATVNTPIPGGKRGKRHDIVMQRLHGVPKDERAGKRMDVAEAAAIDWLDMQGSRNGFSLLRPRDPDIRLVQDYHVLDIPRKAVFANKRDHRMRVGVLDLEGRLEVTNPMAFLSRLYGGFGRAKAFGNGLMLIRRA